MKKSTLITILTLVPMGNILSQERCDKNMDVAQMYLERRKDMRQELREEIKSSLDSCNYNDGRSFYIKGLLELRTKPNPNYSGAFEHFALAAQYDFTKAKTYLGYFYKNGWSVPIDFNKSLYWIEQAAKEGDDNALYTLGYYNLKGLANLNPNYEKAVKYFERSDHPMAKHWLAFCTYFGFGTVKDEYDAESLLEATYTPNSEELLAFLKNAQYGTSLDFEEFRVTESIVPTSFFNTSESEVLYGTWLEKDWKNEQEVRKLPFVLTNESNNRKQSTFVLEIGEREYPFVVNSSGHLQNQDLSVELQSPFSEELIHYSIKDGTLTKALDTGIYDMDLKIWMDEYQEEGAPVTLRILTEEALAKKMDRSLVFYPNAFHSTFHFSFTLEHEGSVTLSLYNLSGNIVRLQNYGTLEPGVQEFEFVAEGINPQNLIAVLSVNNIQLARQVIKTN